MVRASITAPAAVRDSSYGLPNRRCGQTSNAVTSCRVVFSRRGIKILCSRPGRPRVGRLPVRPKQLEAEWLEAPIVAGISTAPPHKPVSVARCGAEPPVSSTARWRLWPTATLRRIRWWCRRARRPSGSWADRWSQPQGQCRPVRGRGGARRSRPHVRRAPPPLRPSFNVLSHHLVYLAVQVAFR
jgi:hypothetical protein